jgi:hypothetical protein
MLFEIIVYLSSIFLRSLRHGDSSYDLIIDGCKEEGCGDRP